MECKMCGRHTQNENANFCEYCGTSFRESYQPVYENNEFSSQGVTNISEQKSDKEAPMSFGSWMKTMFMVYIPFVGPFIYFIMLFVWAFGSETTTTKKNWAKAQLLFIIATLIIGSYFLGSIMNSQEFQDMYNKLS